MLGLLTFKQESVAPLAHDSAEGVIGSRYRWRTLPCADSSAVHERGEKVPVVAWPLKNFSDDLVRVPCHQSCHVDMLALLSVERLIDEKVELDVGARFPQTLDGVEDLELDSNVLFCALRK